MKIYKINYFNKEEDMKPDEFSPTFSWDSKPDSEGWGYCKCITCYNPEHNKYVELKASSFDWALKTFKHRYPNKIIVSIADIRHYERGHAR